MDVVSLRAVDAVMELHLFFLLYDEKLHHLFKKVLAQNEIKSYHEVFF